MSYHSGLTLASHLDILVLQNMNNNETDDLSYNRAHPLKIVLLETGKRVKLLSLSESHQVTLSKVFVLCLSKLYFLHVQ